MVRGDVVVQEGSLLTIAPGTTILFDPAGPGEDALRSHPNFPGSELIVRGHIVAIGTAAEPITFRYSQEDAPAGSWGGINIEQSPQARFAYCYFSQADSALHSRESSVLVDNSYFENNRVAVRFHSSRIEIRNNTFLNNGTAVRFHFGSPIIERNVFLENGKAIFITSHPSDYRIERNNFLTSAEYHVALGEEVPEDVALGGNYWGSDSPQEIASRFYDSRREDYLGTVRFNPFLTSPAAPAGVSWTP